eukprot:3175721-Amphidinium_carterae.1
MLSVPKQQAQKRDLPPVFEGNKPNEQQSPMTTFKNWAAEVQIYMSLEDHNLATMLEDVKTQKVAIVDANYIDYYLHQQERHHAVSASTPSTCRERIEGLTHTHAQRRAALEQRKNKDLVREMRTRYERNNYRNYFEHTTQEQNLYYDAMQKKPGEENQEKTEYRMKQYHFIQNYQTHVNHSQINNK